MKSSGETPISANTLRCELSARNLARGEGLVHETTFGTLPNVVYGVDQEGAHGNFIMASYRRIRADVEWRKRLDKAYTAGARVPRRWDRRRGELECANSSDALLMNVFCYPRLLSRPDVCTLLGVPLGPRPEFGVRAMLLMRGGEVDRTEIDMVLGKLLVEAKLTETHFGKATRERLMRYMGVDEIFDVDELPWRGESVLGYQLIRGVLAAHATEEGRFAVLCDHRRADLTEIWFRVLRAVRRSDVRSRMALLHWQELATVCPSSLRRFLAEKYGIG